MLHQPKKKSLSISVGARVDDVGLGGPLWSPVDGGYGPFIDEPTSSGDPRRATIKAHHPSSQPPSPLRNPRLGLGLMHIGRRGVVGWAFMVARRSLKGRRSLQQS